MKVNDRNVFCYLRRNRSTELSGHRQRWRGKEQRKKGEEYRT